MDTSGVTNATQAVKDSSKIDAAWKQIQTFVESECDQIDGSAKIMFENGNGVF